MFCQTFTANSEKKKGISSNIDMYSSRDMPDTGYISGIQHYPALFEVSSRLVLWYPASTGYFQRSEKLHRVHLVKIKFTFSIYEKRFGASLKTLILFGLSTKSRTKSKP